MAAQDYTSVVQQLYISYFGRPADYYGLKNFSEALNAMGAPKTFAEVNAAVQADKAGTTALSKLVNSFNSSTESAALYGTDNTQIGISKFVNAIYQNVLGRDADLAGFNFWVNAITSGTLTKANAAASITQAALTNTSEQGKLDALTVQNKLAVATSFTTAIDTPAEITAYSGDVAASAARTLLAGVNSSTSLTAYQTNIVDTLNSIGTISNPATTFSLTTGTDILNGTNGNDTFTANTAVIVNPADGVQSLTDTLQVVDTINGGAGVDTLKITAASATVNLPTLSSVEVVEAQSQKGLTIDTSTVEGLTKLSITKVGAAGVVDADAGATTDVSVAMKAAGAAVNVDGGKNVAVNLTGVAGNADVINVGMSAGGKAAAGAVTVNETGVAVAAGTNVTLSAINVKGGSSITVTQQATSDAAAVAADTTGASVTQGAISVTGTAATTTVTLKQDATQFGYEATAAVAGKATTQEITFGAAKAGDVVTVDFGAGTLAFTAKKDLSAAQVASAFANLAKNAFQGTASAELGVYTDATGGVSDGWTSGGVAAVDATHSKVIFTNVDAAAPALTAAVTGTVTASAGTLSVGTDAVDADPGVLTIAAGAVTVADAAGTVKTVSIDSYGVGSAITGGAVLETLNLSHSAFAYTGSGSVATSADITVADTAATLALNLNGVGSSTTSAKAGAVTFTAAPTTLNVKSTGANNIALTAAATETLNVSGTGKLTVQGDLAGVKTVKVTETAGLSLVASNADTITSVDTTGTTGAVTVSIQGDLATYAGGAGVDTVSVTNASTAIAKTIDLGAGNDKLDLSATVAVTPTVELKGGDGTDTIVLSAAAADALSNATTPTFQDKISGFEKLEVGANTAALTVNLDNLDDINYVISNGGTAALTLDKMLANATVELKAAGDTIVKLADVSGAADVVNYVTSASVTTGVVKALGTQTANGVETINFNVQDTDTSIAASGAGNVSTHSVVVDADSAKTVNVSGAGNFVLTLSAATKSVALIDGSTATGKLDITTSAVDGTVATTVKGGAAADVLTAQGANDVLIGGAGNDVLKVVGSAASAVTLTGGDGVDTFDVSGFLASAAGSAAAITDLTKGEMIKFVTSANTDFISSKVTLIAEATFNDYVNEAAKAADAATGDHGISWFQFNGNTFIVQDVNGDGGFTNGADIIVKLTGLVDLTNSSINDAGHGTLLFV